MKTGIKALVILFVGIILLSVSFLNVSADSVDRDTEGSEVFAQNSTILLIVGVLISIIIVIISIGLVIKRAKAKAEQKLLEFGIKSINGGSSWDSNSGSENYWEKVNGSWDLATQVELNEQSAYGSVEQQYQSMYGAHQIRPEFGSQHELLFE